MACDVLASLVCDESTGIVGAAYRDDMVADRMWLASRDERRFACRGNSITLRYTCTRGNDEAIVDGRLEVHSCCCFLFLLLFL
jgi:hypothetical protein